MFTGRPAIGSTAEVERFLRELNEAAAEFEPAAALGEADYMARRRRRGGHRTTRGSFTESRRRRDQRAAGIRAAQQQARAERRRIERALRQSRLEVR
jgi:hypothetical protein